MTGPELYALCKSLADDPDESFMSKQDWANALQMGYSSYQQYISDSIPEIYEKYLDFGVPNGTTVAWTGTPAPGDTATLTINAVPYVYVTGVGDTMTTVANALTVLASASPFANVSNVGAITSVLPVNLSTPIVTATFVGTGGVTLGPVALASIDLNGVLFGPTPSVGKVAYRITKIHTVNVGQQPDFGLWLQPAATMEQLWNITSTTGYGNFNPGKWCLQGTVIKFNLQPTSSMRLYYLPNGPTAAEWLTLITTPASFVDNTPDFAQQCIAFFAYSQYAIKDWSDNPGLQAKFQQLMRQLDQWMAKNRTGDSHRWVQPGRQGLQGGGGWW